MTFRETLCRRDFTLTLHTNGLNSRSEIRHLEAVWKRSNGGETVLTNLLPGSYDFSRIKYGGTVGHEYAFIHGDPFKFVQLTQKIVL